jgi:hypothetical protein
MNRRATHTVCIFLQLVSYRMLHLQRYGGGRRSHSLMGYYFLFHGWAGSCGLKCYSRY